MLQQKVDSLYSDFISYRTYSRWLEEEGRRESWKDSVTRYVNYLSCRVPDNLLPLYADAASLIMKKQVMPSMRLLWSAGPACDENNLAAFNCAYLAMNAPYKFGEMLYVLMHGK